MTLTDKISRALKQTSSILLGLLTTAEVLADTTEKPHYNKVIKECVSHVDIQVPEILKQYKAGERDFSCIRVINDKKLEFLDQAESEYVGDDFQDYDLSGSNFSGAIFINSTFIGTDLSGSNFEGANFQSTELYKANLSGSNMDYVDMEGLFKSLEEQRREAFFNQSKESQEVVDLSHGLKTPAQDSTKTFLYTVGKLRGIYDSKFSTQLTGSNFEGTTFKGANLRGVIIDSDLSKANLDRADLSGSMVCKSKLNNLDARYRGQVIPGDC